MKPCLVQKPSTSDEELLDETNHVKLLSTHVGRSHEQPTHGILKVPS
ncbi:unnamed protein product, partial [Rotaria magnacalcarata]